MKSFWHISKVIHLIRDNHAVASLFCLVSQPGEKNLAMNRIGSDTQYFSKPFGDIKYRRCGARPPLSGRVKNRLGIVSVRRRRGLQREVAELSGSLLGQPWGTGKHFSMRKYVDAFVDVLGRMGTPGRTCRHIDVGRTHE